MKRRDFLAQAGVAAALSSLGRTASAGSASGPSAVIAWNQALTGAIAASFSPPTVAARALSMVYEAVYNAWVGYGNFAYFTLSGLRYRPSGEWKTSNKTIAIGYAAHGVLSDLFPLSRAAFDDTLAQTLAGLAPGTTDAVSAQLFGKATAVALLQARNQDGSNQLGDLAPGSYGDWSGYASVNAPDPNYAPLNGPFPNVLVDPMRWQPLRVTSALGVQSVQQFVTPHWGQVRPFALASGSALRPAFSLPTKGEMDELIGLSARLDDADKAQVDFFANNPGSVTPPGQWSKFAEIVSANDANTLDEDVVLFFVLGQAMLDASIACWEAKRYYDSARPYAAIRWYYRDQSISAWGGPGNGPRTIRGASWLPYQRPTVPSPAFPEFCSGHSTFSAAAAACIALLRGSDSIALKFTFPGNGVPFDRSVPAAPVALRWNSLSEVADAAGYSRRLGGIHFEQGDLKGRALGKQVAQAVIRKGLTLVRMSAIKD